jgi:Fe-S cluster biogenesis protein NfuA
VRPGLQADGGDLEILELDGNILTIRYEGACGGCPSAMMGTLQAIEGILRTEFNPYLEVVAV